MIRPQFITNVAALMGGADVSPFMAAATRVEQLTAKFTPSGSQLSQTARIFICTPEWDSYDWVFYFPGWWVDGGGTALEMDAENNISIDGAALEYSGAFYPLTFGGAPSIVVTPGGLVKSDPVRNAGARLTTPGRSNIFLRLASSVTSGQTIPGGYRQQTQNGEAIEFTASPQLSKLAGGTITGTGNTNYGPCGALARGWNGNYAVCGVACDSIGVGAAESQLDATTRGAIGHPKRGLDNETVRRDTAWMLGMNGTSFTSSDSLSAGEFRRRGALVQDAVALNGGVPPITHWLSEHGVNSSGGGWPALQNFAIGLYTFLVTLANVPIVQTTLTPRTDDSTNNKWTNLTDQIQSGADATYPSGDRYQFNAAIKTPSGRTTMGLFGYVDLDSIMFDPTTHDKWPIYATSGTLQASISGGATTLSIDFQPHVGNFLVVEAGSVGVEQTPSIKTVTGSGPYTVTLTRAMISAHASTSIVKEASVVDATHPSAYLHDQCKPFYDAAKAAGYFGIQGLPNHAPTNIALSSLTMFTDTTVGATVATITATDQDVWDSQTFSLLDDAGGKFSISGNNLLLAATVTAGTYNIQIKATDTGANTFDKSFAIVASDPSSSHESLGAFIISSRARV